MKRKLLYIFIFLLPFLVIIGVNEYSSSKRIEKGYSFKGIEAINPLNNSKSECSWKCYYDTTSHCKAHHTKIFKPYFKYIDPFYNGQIKALHAGGNYQLINVLVFVIILPTSLFILIIGNIELYLKLKRIKQQG